MTRRPARSAPGSALDFDAAWGRRSYKRPDPESPASRPPTRARAISQRLQASSRSRAASAAAAAAGVPAALLVRADDPARGGDQPAGRARARTPRRGPPPARPAPRRPGAGTPRAGISSRSRSIHSGAVAPTTAPTSASPVAPGRARPSRSTSWREPLGDRPAVAERQLLDVGGTRVGGAHEHEQAARRRSRAASTSGAQRVPAEQRVDGQRVGARGPATSPYGVAVAPKNACA